VAWAGVSRATAARNRVVGSGGQRGADSDLSGLRGWGSTGAHANSLFVASLKPGPRVPVAPATVRGEATRVREPR
jgi:hypothetical protein